MSISQIKFRKRLRWSQDMPTCVTMTENPQQGNIFNSSIQFLWWFKDIIHTDETVCRLFLAVYSKRCEQQSGDHSSKIFTKIDSCQLAKKFGVSQKNTEGTVKFYLSFFIKTPLGEWAVPGSTAIPGQPVEKSEQAPASSPRCKNQFNIDVPRWGTYQILSW